MIEGNSRVTVGVTCYNNGDNIDHLIEDLQHQLSERNRDIGEIVVVASGCTDNTVSQIREKSALDSRIRLIVEQHRNGKPSAINKILHTMTGDILVLVSGDIRLPDEHFIEKILLHFRKGADIVACRPLPTNGTCTRAGYIGQLIWNLHDKTLAAQIKNGLRKQAGEAFAIRRKVAKKIPCSVINDDAYLVLNAQIDGGRFAYAREVVARNRTPERFRDILWQRARIIRGHRQLRNVIGVAPNALDILMLKQPLIVARVLIQEVKEQIAQRTLRIICFLQLLILEIAAHILSETCNFSHLWPTAESAKWDREAT